MENKKFAIYSNLTSNTQKAMTLQKTKQFGELKDKIVVYTPFEAFYLIETNKAEFIKNKKSLSKQQTEKILIKNKNKNKYLVFRYLRKQGYIVKTGLKFGGEFRVYERNKNHATYITYIINKKIDLSEFISRNRIAHSTAKKLLLAIVDEEQSILFYEVNWKKP